MAQDFPTTKSIDVGSMFLMDLSVHESELNSGLSNDAIASEEETFFSVLGLNKPNSTHQRFIESNPNQISSTRSIAYNLNNHKHATQHLQDVQQPEYLSNSLHRLASAIDATSSTNSEQLSSVTIVEPQPPPDIVAGYQSSLSDESFVASSGNSFSASYTASSEAEEEERGSTTTREDSGVLDMKDLDSQINNSYDNEHEEDKVCHYSFQPLQQEKPISNNNTAKNLINESAITNHNHNSSFINYPNRPDNKPTNSNHTTNNNHHHSGQSKRSMSASLPIQVPARQMKKDLNKLKLGLFNKNLAKVSTEAATTMNAHGKNNRNLSTATGDNRQSSVAVDDVDEFLEQEFNENHHNHYPIDEYDADHLRADENPMKLFASIQALARSLHEDTELFGSLPPKRLLESPIRSLALV